MTLRQIFEMALRARNLDPVLKHFSMILPITLGITTI